MQHKVSFQVEFSFPQTGCLTKAKEAGLLNCFPIWIPALQKSFS